MIVPVHRPAKGYDGPRVVIVAWIAILAWVMPAGAQEGGPYGPVPGLPITLDQLGQQSAWIPGHLAEVEAERQQLESELDALRSAAETPVEVVPAPVESAPAAEPLSRRDSVAHQPAKPPRFAGRSEILEVAYGLDEAVVECVAFRVCMIVLEAGEQIVDRNMGDVDRWNYRESYAGPAGAETPVVVVQPLDFDLETNLLVLTDRRVYRLRLLGLAKPKKGATVAFTEALSFRYPARSMEIAEPPPRPVPPADATPSVAASPLGSLNFGYRVETPRRRSERFQWRPSAVFDDGERLFVYLPEAAFLDDAPLLVGLDAEDEPVQVNAVLERDPRTGRRYFAVPRLLGSLELFVGQGPSRRWLRIHRNGPLGER